MKKTYDKGLALGTGESTIPSKNICMETHEEVAARIFGVPIDKVTPEQRQYAKMASHLVFYGASDITLINNLPEDHYGNIDFSCCEARVLAWANENRNKAIYKAHKKEL